MQADALVIGGGIIGLATAYKLLRARPGSAVVVLEKEPAVASHQSGRNSGVLHAGLAYLPGSAKARLAADGRRQLVGFCERHDVPHRICGKIVVATAEREVPALRELMQRGEANGLRGLEWLDAEGVRAVEPHARGLAGLRVPEEGVVDYPAVCRVLVREIGKLGGAVMTGAPVRTLRREGGRWLAQSGAGAFSGGLLVNCAGLHADRLARRAGAQVSVRIVPFRGEYFTVRANRASLVRGLVYPVPSPEFPFLGVHLTRSVHDVVEAGPNAVLALAREGYTRRSIRPRDALGTLAFSGLWRFVRLYPGPCWTELRRSLSRRAFASAARRLVPELAPDDLVRGRTGVRAQAMRPDGRLVQDFLFVEGPAAIHLLNVPSPGATAALAIGDEIVRRLLGQEAAAISASSCPAVVSEEAGGAGPARVRRG